MKNHENISSEKWNIPENYNLGDFQWVNTSGNGPGTCILGIGSFGEVRLCKNNDGKLFACKILEKQKIIRNQMENYVKQEISLQMRMKHAHIIKLYGCTQDKKFIYIFLDYCKNNSLYKSLKKQSTFKEKSAFVFFFQTALGINYF
jgi:protein kinase A